MRLPVLVVLPLLVLAGCGGGDTSSGGAPAMTAQQMVDHLKSAVPTITDVVPLTEDNDSNNLLGRPGQYDAAVWFADSRLDCPASSKAGLDTGCGGKVEHWSSQADAQARADDIQSKLKQYGLGAEYDYVVGSLVVRVSGDLKPSDAAVYEQASKG